MTQLEKYYNKFKEEHRLTTRHGKVEFAVSMKHIHDCAEIVRKTCSENQAETNENRTENKQIKILDIGAGTGRYSVALSEEGFDVTAVELVKHNLDILMSKHAKVKCWPGDARNLSFLPDETFDVTLLFGPMYHLHSDEDRLAALNEAKRVTKKGGFILVAYVMNEYAILSYCFKEGKILECVKNGTITKDFHTITELEKDLYSYTRLEDMTRLNEKAGLLRVKTFAPDGAADYMRREINALDEESFEWFIKYQMSVSERKELLGASSHTVDILQKL